MVGAGTMGNGIAQVFAQAGFDVRLHRRRRRRRSIARAASIEKSLAQVRREGQAHGRRSATRRSARLTTGTTVDALADVDYVVEAIVEDAQREARRCSPGSTSSTRPDVILALEHLVDLDHAARRRDHAPGPVLGMHFMNPVPLMTLVELIRGQATSPESMLAAAELCMRLGKTGGRSGRLSRASSPTAS